MVKFFKMGKTSIRIEDHQMGDYDPDYFSELIECHTQPNAKIMLSLSRKVVIHLIETNMYEVIEYLQSVVNLTDQKAKDDSGNEIKRLCLIDCIHNRIFVNDKLIAFTTYHPVNSKGIAIKPLYCIRFHKRIPMEVADRVIYCPRCKYVLTDDDISLI